MKAILPLALCAALCAPMFALAQSDAGPEISAETAGEPASEPDLLAEGQKVYDAYKALRDRDEAVTRRMAIAGLVAAALSLLIAIGRKFSAKIDAKRKWIPWLLLGLGVAVGVVDLLAVGHSWKAALISGGGPPLSILIHQLLKNAPGANK